MSKEAIIIGYSGHGLVVADLLTQLDYEIIGYCDHKQNDDDPFDLIFLGSEDRISFEDSEVFIGIGDNYIREKVSRKLYGRVFFGMASHPRANISYQNVVSSGTVVLAGAIINTAADVGIGVIINSGAIIEHHCKINDFAHIAPGAVLAGNVTVGKRSFIGANATIIQGIAIGNDVIVGAGAVIINDIPDNCTVVGNPGRIIKQTK